MAHQRGADAVMEGIAGGEDAYGLSTMRQHFLDPTLERRKPWTCNAANERSGQSDMPPPAEYNFSRLHKPARRYRQTLDSVLADPDNGQPAPRCGTVLQQRIRKRHAARLHT